MQSVIMPPSTSLRLLASIAEEASPETPSRVHLEVSSSASPPAMHSQIVIPSGSDFDTSEGYDDLGDFVSESPVDCTQLVDDRVRQSAASLASSLSVMRQVKGLPCQNDICELNGRKNIVAKEVGSHGDGNGKQGNDSGTNKEKDLVENCPAR
jgi:hypothetical protein